MKNKKRKNIKQGTELFKDNLEYEIIEIDLYLVFSPLEKIYMNKNYLIYNIFNDL